MKFNSVIIKNFRNFEDISIDLTNKNVFFGMNDVGKTNFLYALRFVFDKDIRKQNFSDTDYYKKKVDVPIEIVIAIVHPEVESNYLKKYNRKSLFIPENAFFRPDINNLHYHQTHIYGLFKTSGSLVKAAGYYGNTASVVSMVAEGKGSYGSNSNN